MGLWDPPYIGKRYAQQSLLRRIAIRMFGEFVLGADGTPRYAFYKGVRYQFPRR